jgi:methylphosphotriester-DNA--protein-cysteine methyltransferase
MYYKELAPLKALAPYVKCIWVLEDEKPAGIRPLEKVLPDACPELIIHYGDRFRIKTQAGNIKTQPRSFVFGPLTRHIEIGPTGASGIISVRFYPGGLSAFSAVPVKSIINSYVSLTSFFGPAAAAIEEEVCAAKTLKKRKALIETFLLSVLNLQELNPLLPSALLENIISKQEPVSIDELSEKLNIGRRHLERRFNRETGMTPKMLLKIVRFQNVFKIIRQKKVKSLTTLTYEAGYFDQSHFYRDFKEFSGLSPKEYFKEDAELTRLFVGGA